MIARQYNPDRDDVTIDLLRKSVDACDWNILVMPSRERNNQTISTDGNKIVSSDEVSGNGACRLLMDIRTDCEAG